METFRSTAHPGEHSAAYIHGQSLIRPLATCMLPIMIVTLVAVLEGRRVLPALMVASAVAFLIASAWTHFQLRRTPAALHVIDGYAAVQTVWGVLSKRPKQDWAPVLDVRERPRTLFTTIGYESFVLEKDNWPEHDRLSRTLANALHHSLQSAPRANA